MLEQVRGQPVGCMAREAGMSKHKDTQGIARTGRGEQQPLDKDRAQQVSVTNDGPPSHDKRGLDESDRKSGKKPNTSGHS
jgi:hypothetical protein